MASSSEGPVSSLQEPEREPLRFHVSGGRESQDVKDVRLHMKQVAESLLYHWKKFPIVLPPSLTNIGHEKGLINYKDLFVAPSFDELEQVATDPFGNLKKLTDAQLKSVWDKGEFEVPSVNFPGQVHRWKLSQLLQKGSDIAHDSLLDDSALALRLLIITARNRVVSPTFSLSESFKSWGRGLWKILDILFGMPSTSAGDIEQKIKVEHQRYLIAELDVKPNYRQGFGKFCQFVKDTCRMSTRERKKSQQLRPPSVPYIYQTPKGMDIDLRLFNKDLINNCLPVLSNILEREARGWYVAYRQKLIVNLKGQGLSNEQISERVNEAVKEEYLQRIYKAILNNAELETIEHGIGALLVYQAKSVICMKRATSNLNDKMQHHKTELLAHLKRKYTVKSRIEPWVEEQLVAFEREFIEQNLWSDEAITLCDNEDLQQTVYFLRRDLNFIKEREAILLNELSQVRIPNRVFTFSVRIWFPQNWVTVKKVADGEEMLVPTMIAEQGREVEYHLSRGGTRYYLNKNTNHKTSTRYPLWRWYNYLQRTWAWTWNSIFFFGVIIPWCSPLSLRALFFINEFRPNKEIFQQDGKLYPDHNSTTHTLISRLSALWESVRKSRKSFESSPDRGFLGKSFTRHLNRFWNYVVKGFFGSLMLVFTFPVLCIVTTTLSLTMAVTAPAWVPVAALLFQLFCIAIYDFDAPYQQNRFSILCEAFIWRFLIQGTIQPVAASLFGFVACPLASFGIIVFGVLRRGLRGIWDTAMYGIVIKSRARVPASDGFVARRVAGPGLASNYFLQIQPEQALAALEADLEFEELDLYKSRAMKLIEKPLTEYSNFVAQVFKPFSAGLEKDGVYKELLDETSNYRTDLTNKIGQRQRRLNIGLNLTVQNKIKLPEKQLKLTILQAAKMLEAFYPGHVFNHRTISEEDFWEKKTLEYRDWTGLASQKLSGIFSPAFLVPMEDTDSHFELKVQHLNLGRYITMLESTDVHDDLDIVTEVHTNTGDVSTRPPQLDVAYFNPTENLTQTQHYRTLRKKKYLWSRRKLEAEFIKMEIPLPIPHPAVIAMTIYNRENEQYALNLDDTLCNAIIKAIKSFTDIADPVTTDSADFEPSTPDNGVEPVSIVSHLAEQEQSISDDSAPSATSPMLEVTTEVTKVTPSLEHKMDTYAEAYSDDDEAGLAVIGNNGTVYITEARAETVSVDTTNDVGEDIYLEEGLGHGH
ncbi:uncharacterized protein LOC123563530 [Mercenaria mercenaria]|uniref:uncharacterized protein LOC123563530 n=1 Tax=Mercenaria mercenaria TaxID=6596 RepID=UPI00234F2F5F|nr:uncharacterized protein LOC123563530 [Mercenaria mercenaria]